VLDRKRDGREKCRVRSTLRSTLVLTKRIIIRDHDDDAPPNPSHGDTRGRHLKDGPASSAVSDILFVVAQHILSEKPMVRRLEGLF
jgi:hypothetical protein